MKSRVVERLVLVLGLSVLSAADDDQSKLATPAQQFEALLKEHEAVPDDLAKATTDDDRQKVLARLRTLPLRFLELADKPFALVGVNLNRYNADELKKATDVEQMNWRSFADPGEINAKWNAMPQTIYLIDTKGTIANKWVGSPAATVMEAALEKLIQQAEGKDSPK